MKKKVSGIFCLIILIASISFVSASFKIGNNSHEIQNTYERDLIEVAAEIGAQRNPLIREVLLQQVSARFLDWMEGL